MIRRHPRAAFVLAVTVAVALIAGLIWWAIAFSGPSCKPGYKLRYQYTQIIGQSQIVHYHCVRAR